MSAKELNIGDYVRTKGGLIGKVIEIKGNSKTYFILNRQENDVIEIIKSSPNIIDLIQVGDYVNGVRITEIKDGKPFKEDYNDPYFSYYFEEKDIKSIVTKEQFESIEYKIGE